MNIDAESEQKKKPYTVEDYLAIPDEYPRYELR
jgi:hypothetical protein